MRYPIHLCLRSDGGIAYYLGDSLNLIYIYISKIGHPSFNKEGFLEDVSLYSANLHSLLVNDYIKHRCYYQTEVKKLLVKRML